MDRGNHNGVGSGFYCTECPSQEAYVDYSRDPETGVLNGLLLTCTRCGHFWVEARGTS